MSSKNPGLQGYVGIYKQNDGSTFVVTLEGNQLFLKTSSVHSEKCTLRADGLFGVENTKALLNFQIGPNGIAHTLTFILPDRQTVATRSNTLFKEQSFFEKFKELLIASSVFFALIGLFFILQGPIQNACKNQVHPVFCQMATLSSKFTAMKNTDYSAIEKRTAYKQITEDTKDACDEGEYDACLLMAKNLSKLGKLEESESLLLDTCTQKNHYQSCSFLKSQWEKEGRQDEALKLLSENCNKDLPQNCHDLAWIYQKRKDNAKANIYFDKACELDEVESCFHLGKFHIKFERQLSKDYLKKACDRYHRKSCKLHEKVEKYFKNLSLCNNDQSGSGCFLTASFEQDYGEKTAAIKIYRKSCDYGYKLACNIVKDHEARERLKNQKKVDTI